MQIQLRRPPSHISTLMTNWAPFQQCQSGFQKRDGGFSTTFYRIPAELTEKGVERGVEKLTEKEQIILKLIIENAKISKEEMEHQGNLTKKSIEYNIRKLKDKGLLRRVGPARGGYWEVVDK